MLILPIKDEIKRDFYTQMSLIEKWVVRDLKEKIDSNLFERTVLSKKPEYVIKESIKKLIENSEMSTDLVFRDPYLLNFLGFKDSYSESDLETAILNQLEEFIQEFGSDFCFVARQKTMSTANTDRRLDLLFFHRRLRRLIAIELKLTKFEPSHKGQMEWYLSWLDKHERLPHEEKPLGIILCAEKDHEDVEYLEMDASGIHVAQYITELPPRNLLEKKVRIAMKIATEQIEKNKLEKEEVKE
jgi:predicted nuclease of restriction endonuclease-like (RecB) superfamily